MLNDREEVEGIFLVCVHEHGAWSMCVCVCMFLMTMCITCASSGSLLGNTYQKCAALELNQRQQITANTHTVCAEGLKRMKIGKHTIVMQTKRNDINKTKNNKQQRQQLNHSHWSNSTIDYEMKYKMTKMIALRQNRTWKSVCREWVREYRIYCKMRLSCRIYP